MYLQEKKEGRNKKKRKEKAHGAKIHEYENGTTDKVNPR